MVSIASTVRYFNRDPDHFLPDDLIRDAVDAAAHPFLLCAAIGQQFVEQRRAEQQRRRQAHQNALAEFERINRINAENQRRRQQLFGQHRQLSQPIPHDPWGQPQHPHDSHHPYR
ncbi:MAG: hypothetical protein AAGI37_15395 [Planctomycetota bacterium]